jgi:hypothetical protein
MGVPIIYRIATIFSIIVIPETAKVRSWDCGLFNRDAFPKLARVLERLQGLRFYDRFLYTSFFICDDRYFSPLVWIYPVFQDGKQFIGRDGEKKEGPS